MRFRCPVNGLFTRYIDTELGEDAVRSSAYRLLGCLNCVQGCQGPEVYRGRA